MVEKADRMNTQDENHSLTGKVTEERTLLKKSGIAVFVVGLLFLLSSHFRSVFSDKESGILVSFLFMYVGAILFTLDKNGALLFYKKQSRAYFQLLALIPGFFALSYFVLIWLGVLNAGPHVLVFIVAAITVSILSYIFLRYTGFQAGGLNRGTYHDPLSSRGLIAWGLGIGLTLFYIQLYWFPDHLKELTPLFDSLSMLLRDKEADRWFMYGSIYTFVILLLGIKFILKHRHNPYQLLRTCSLIFSQFVFAYFLPLIMESMSYVGASDSDGNYLGYYSSNPVNSWPLNYTFFEPGTLKAYVEPAHQPVGEAFLVWGVILFLVITPILTYFVGKRWYCSWLCGCGGLAETAGDSFRQLSSKSRLSWKIERWLIHGILFFVAWMTLSVMFTYFSNNELILSFTTVNKTGFFIMSLVLIIGFIILLIQLLRRSSTASFALKLGLGLSLVLLLMLILGYFGGNSNAFLFKSSGLKKTYGFLIGAAFSGVIGVGFYPILGNRVWCRFGCPMAAYMGIFQRHLSRFRITTNGSQCISCGNCSVYCEQGIDVRSYAQKGEDISRASCVGCGICSTVCPRGVLKLENAEQSKKTSDR